MVRYFKINDPYRLLTLFLFIVTVRILVLTTGHEFTGLHEQYFASGGELSIGPLFQWLVQLINFAFNDPSLPSAILSGLLITLQAFSLNSILIRSKALTQNTYLPAACYVIVLSASPEFILLSPALCAVTFLLVGINYMLFHLQYRGSEENILSTGFVFGASILFHPPSAVFIILLFSIYAIYSSTLNRRYGLIAFGILLPFVIVWLIFFYQDQGAVFWTEIAAGIFSASTEVLVPLNQLVLVVGLPILVALVSSSQTFTGAGLTVHQIVTQRTFLFFGFFAIVSVILNDKISANSVIYLAPSLAFFGAQFLLTRERKWLSEVTLILLLVGSLALAMLPLFAPDLSPVDYGLLR